MKFRPLPARFVAGASLVLLPLLAGIAAAADTAGPQRLSDGTTVESWALPNGIQVVARDVPGAAGVALTLAYGLGTEQDPAGREGWTQLLAHVDFLSAAGEFPERSLDAMGSIRPLGWRIEVGRRYTRLTEVGGLSQFPGMLHQMAQRVKSPAPSAKVLAEARKAVQAQLATNYRDRVAFALFYNVRETNASAARYATGKGIEGASLREVQDAIRSWYVPANAVLSLAGDLRGTGVDLRRLIANEFGVLAPGSRATFPPPVPPAPGIHTGIRTDLDEPAGVIGIIAPALSDTSHPSFFVNAMVVGSLLTARWGRSDAFPARFQYSLLDDPDLVRLYPPVTPSDLDSTRIREEYGEGLLDLAKSTMTFDQFSTLHDGVVWLLGGPLPPELARRAATDSGVLATLSTTAAMRVLWGGDAFWTAYRNRYLAIDRPAFARWADYFRDSRHQAQFIFVPDYLTKKP